METISLTYETVSKAASKILKEEGRLSLQETLAQVGIERASNPEEKFESQLTQSTEVVNGTFGAIRLREELLHKDEQAVAQVRSDLDHHHQRSEQIAQFKLKEGYTSIQSAIDQAEEYLGYDSREVQTEKPFYSEYDVALLRIKLKSRKEQTKTRRNPIKSAVRFIGDGLSALWTKGANRDSMTETAAMTQAAG